MIDLHTHSLRSDGTDIPYDLVDKAVKKGIHAIALTDHDTTDGITDFLAAAEGKPIIAVPGIELGSFLFTKEVHIVGLFIDPLNSSLQQATTQMIQWRQERNLKIIDALQKAGYDITVDEVRQAAGGISIGRPHIASVLVKRGYFREKQAVFTALIGRNTPCYVERKHFSPAECIKFIHDAGGLAIWAHAVFGQRGPGGFLRKLGRRMINAGIDGIECYYSGYSELQSREALKYAKENNLLVSGGSDYHGNNNKNITLGTGCDNNLNIPFHIYQSLHDAWEARNAKTL